MRIRRRNPCFIEIHDALAPDFSALLRGTARLEPTVAIDLLCPISGDRIPLSDMHVAFLARLSAMQWYEMTDLAAEGPLAEAEILSLVDRGILVSDADIPLSVQLRDAEARLESVGWHPQAALYHALTRWTGIEGEEGRRDHGDDAHGERLRAHASAHGELPAHFHRREDVSTRHALAAVAYDDAFAQVLRARRTTRHFDTTAALPLADFTRVLHGTFGVVGTEVLAPRVVALKRTSASGGALHPIEAYPLVVNVQGLEPGFYHYETGSHSLALIAAMTEKQAREHAAALTIGQTYFAEAHALVFHVARLDRHHWKYRRHPKAYKAVLLDSGHLSQTFYLLAADRGLGAFYTAAINDVDVGALLKLDPLTEIVIGANGIGVPDPGRNQLHLRPEPYEPVAAPVAP